LQQEQHFLAVGLPEDLGTGTTRATLFTAFASGRAFTAVVAFAAWSTFTSHNNRATVRELGLVLSKMQI